MHAFNITFNGKVNNVMQEQHIFHFWLHDDNGWKSVVWCGQNYK